MATLAVASWRQEPFTVLDLSGELQHTTLEDAEAQILSTILLGPSPMHLVLNMTAVTFLDSGGVNLLAKTRFAVRSSRGSLRLVVPPGRAREVLRITGLDQALRIVDDLDHALIDEPRHRS